MAPDPATRLLEAIWGQRPPGLIQIWQLTGRRSTYLARPRDAAAWHGMADIYTGVALAGRDHGGFRRARASEAEAIGALWADIDVNGGPERKTGAAPDMAQAIALATEHAPPSVLVASGYGLQAWWLLDRPWGLRNNDERSEAQTLAARWQEALRRLAREWGFGLDATHDLARLLRLPGTVNAKGGHSAPVELIALDPKLRYTRPEAEERVQGVGEIVAPVSDPGPGTAPVEITGHGRRALDEVKLQALIVNSSEFADTWRHARDAAWSMSEYDLALCSIAAQAGFSDQELCELIALHRRLHDPADPKATRLDYIGRTVRKARESAAHAEHAAWFSERASAGGDDPGAWFARKAREARAA